MGKRYRNIYCTTILEALIPICMAVMMAPVNLLMDISLEATVKVLVVLVVVLEGVLGWRG